jgi:DNA polymerase-3 subunit gamma/tau
LENAIESGRVAHAFLFTGARGVGKTSSARILAKALDCETGTTAHPCNTCTACTEITAGTAVDVLEIDGASNTGVDDIRELRETVKYLPSRCRYKIIIIDEVHMLSTNAFNALLKTLEEPPPHVKFIFATTEPHKVPITILSRCQRFDFKRIPLPKIISRLRYIVDAEGITISADALAMISRKGDGSMRDSLSVLDQVMAFSGNEVVDADVAGLLGMVDRRLLVECLHGIVARDSARLLELIKQVDSFGYSMRQFCQELIEMFRALVIIRTVKDPGDFLDIAEAELETLREIAGSLDLATLQRSIAVLIKAESEMAQSGYQRLLLEMVLLRMASFADTVPVRELIDRLKSIEEQISEAPAPPEKKPIPRQEPPLRGSSLSQSPPTPYVAAPQRDEGAGKNDWGALVSFVRSKKPLIGSILDHGRPMEMSERRVAVGFPPNSHFMRSLKDPETFAALKALVVSYFKGERVIDLVPLTEGTQAAAPTLAEKKSREDADRVTRLRKEAEAEPLVTAALEIFGGEISEVKDIDK